MGSFFERVVLTAGDQVIEMRRVMVTSLSIGGSASEKAPTENITLNFAEYCVRRPLGDTCWNIAANAL